MRGKGGCCFELVPLGSHVAVRDIPSLALLAHCFAGDDWRDRERHRRDQEPAHLRRVMQMGSAGHFRWPTCVALSFDSAAMAFVDGFSMVAVVSIPVVQFGRPRSFVSLTGQRYQAMQETCRLQSTVGMDWRQYMLGRIERRPA